MFYVYLLRSLSNPSKTYIGLTSDLKRRVIEHNERKSPFTKSYKPWKLETYIAFSHEKQAIEFEKYLKQGTGYAFAAKHFWCRANAMKAE
jgi:putative endonuclease